MKSVSSRKLALESLEDRLAPAISGIVSNGVLNIRGFSSTQEILLTPTATPGEIEVSDSVNTFTATGVQSINVRLTAGGGAQNVILFFNAGLSPINGSVTIDAGPSPGNSITVFDNTPDSDFEIVGSLTLLRSSLTQVGAVDIGGNLTVNNTGYNSPLNGYTISGVVGVSGQILGNLTVNGGLYGDGAILSAIRVRGSAQVNLGGSTLSLANSLSTDVNTVVHKSLAVSGGPGANVVTLSGQVLGAATIRAGNGQNNIDFDSTGLVGKSMSISLGRGTSGGNQVGTGAGFTGTINGNLTITAAGGTTQVDLGATVYGPQVTIALARGFNTLNFISGLDVVSGRMTVNMVRGGINVFNPNAVPVTWPFRLYF